MTQMKRIISLGILVTFAGFVSAAQAKVKPEIMGVALDMNHDAAEARLKLLGQLEKADRKRQEVWAIRDSKVSHLIVGYDDENRVRYVTAIARTDGPRIRYYEVGDLKSATWETSRSNRRFTWSVPEQEGHFAYVVIAQGRDPDFLDYYSVKKPNEKEID